MAREKAIRFIEFIQHSASAQHPNITAFFSRIKQASYDLHDTILTEENELFLSSWIQEIITAGKANKYESVFQVANYLNTLYIAQKCYK